MDVTITPTTSLEALAAAVAASDRGRTEDAPLRVTVEAGVYDLRVNPLLVEREHKQVFGAGARFINGTTAIGNDARTLLIDGLELDGADFAGFGGFADSQLHILQNLYCHDLKAASDGIGCDSLEGSTLKGAYRAGGPTALNKWITRILHSRFHEWAGAAGTTHNVYLHGDEAELEVGWCEFAGGPSSAIKSTRNVNHVHHTKIYTERAMLGGGAPVGGRAYSKFIDVPAFTTLHAHENEFHFCRGRRPGTTEVIWLNPRRSRTCGDIGVTPADVSFQRRVALPITIEFGSTAARFDAEGVYATLNGARLATEPVSKYLNVEQRATNKDVWYVTILPHEIPTSGVYRLGIEHDGKRRAYRQATLTVFRDAEHILVSSYGNATVEKLARSALPDWWATLGDLTDPDNENALRQFITHNSFTRHHPEGFGPRKPIRLVRNDGTYPRSEVRQFSNECFWHPVPEGWRERSSTFLQDNSIDGVLPEELAADGIRAGGYEYRPGFDVRFGEGECRWLDRPEYPRITVA